MAVILLTKTPGCLPVKTRLALDLGAEAEVLYSCFLQDIGVKLSHLNLPVLVCHLPGDASEQPALQALLGTQATFSPQMGVDLGERMHQAIVSAFARGWQKVLLIGGDCPDLPPTIFETAFELLNSADCVLGPTRDGGYYAIGFRQAGFRPEVFAFSDWGASSVFAATLERLHVHQTQVALLPEWRDVDTLADLQALYQRNQVGWFADSFTMQALKQRDACF
jgi:uncharacterized protein